MLSKDNLEALRMAGVYCIVGAKLEQWPIALQGKVLDSQLIQHLKANQTETQVHWSALRQPCFNQPGS